MLTELEIRNAKAQPQTRKLSDGGGLQLWVTPKGSKLWNLAYRFEGKQKKLSLGPYPTLGLRGARDLRDEARCLLHSGIDPSEHRKSEATQKAKAGANTFAVVADDLLEKKRLEHRAETTLSKTAWLLDFARPKLGKRPISAITAAEVLEVLQAIQARGTYETARRLRSTIGEVFRLAIATGRAAADPTYVLRGALVTRRPKHRAALTEPKAFGGLLRAIRSYNGALETRAALELLALTFVRPGELRAARWSEFELDKAVWDIPADRMKMRRAHSVPLAPQVLTLLRDLQKTATTSAFLFPSPRTTLRPISDGTLIAALRRLGYTSDEMVPHGFRAVASSMLNDSMLWKEDVIEFQLAHVGTDEIRAIYNRAKYWHVRVPMMAWWADQIDAMRGSNLPSGRPSVTRSDPGLLKVSL